ncbi:MAG: AlkZ family DNA glycosylase [Bacteroidales bacterium]|nr:AlkZ family DNA glycosylase [Bacteroidales bacterium]
MSPATLRLLNQQLVCPQFGTPAEVVEYMGAMQAQEYRMMRWAVAMRTGKPSAKAFKEAFDSGQIVRLHLMRGTWQLVAADDYWPLLELCAPKALAVIKGWMSSNKISIPDDEVARLREILVSTASDKGSVTKEDFVQALAEHDISMDDHRLSYHIRYAELSGTLCSGDLLPMKATYALAADKVKNRLRMDRDEALMMLARKYFRSRQPATLEDFVWWSGLNIGDCRRAIELLGDYIHVEMHGRASAKREFYYTDDCRTRGFRKGRCLFIPPYDEYLIGYKSRDIVLSPEFRHKAHNNSGIFQPVIARNGIICGNWAPFSDDCRTSFFIGEHDDSVQEEWTRYKLFLEK